jgi:aspartokinase
MCAVKLNDLTVEKMFGRKKKQESYVAICDSFVRTDDDTLTVGYEDDRVLWNIDLTSSLGDGVVKAFDVQCWQEVHASMVEIEREKILFNTGNECFVKVFEKLSSYGYQIKAYLGCARVCIQGSQMRSSTNIVLSVINALNGSSVPVLQLVKSADLIELMIEERYLPDTLAALSKKLKLFIMPNC